MTSGPPIHKRNLSFKDNMITFGYYDNAHRLATVYNKQPLTG